MVENLSHAQPNLKDLCPHIVNIVLCFGYHIILPCSCIGDCVFVIKGLVLVTQHPSSLMEISRMRCCPVLPGKTIPVLRSYDSATSLSLTLLLVQSLTSSAMVQTNFTFAFVHFESSSPTSHLVVRETGSQLELCCRGTSSLAPVPIPHLRDAIRNSALVQARASGLLDVDDADVAVGRCVDAWLKDDDEFVEFVKRGLSGDDMVDTRAADDEEEMFRAGCLRKTRAGGNWLTGGIVKF
jgi:hypothetical protein